MKKSISEIKLQESWEKVTNESGTLLQLTPTRSREHDNYKIIVIKCRFQRFDVDIQLVFNEDGEISGLNFTPINNAYNPPIYVNESAFHDVDVEVGEGKWALPEHYQSQMVQIISPEWFWFMVQDQMIGMNQ